MKIRAAEPADSGRIETIAHDSLRSSYSLSPQQIETIVESEFAPERLEDRFDDPDSTVLVAEATVEDSQEIQGFVVVDTGNGRRLRWLHVDPQARGNGVGTALVERLREEGHETPLSASVLEDAVEGGEFLEAFGLENDGTDTVQIGEEEFSVVVFTEGHSTADSNEPAVSFPEVVDIDGTEYTIDQEDRIPGRSAPFFPIHETDHSDDPYGYFCSNCGSTDVAADGLDRLECGDCENAHMADEWDDSYL